MKLAVGLLLAAVAVATVNGGDPATLSTKEEATKTTKATKSSKSEKTGTASSSGIGSLFDDGSNGVIGDESAADGKVDPKMLTSIGITVPLGKEGSGGLNLGPGPAVYPSDSGSWDWSWDSIEGSSSTHYDCDTVCPADYEPVCGSDNVTYKNDCTFTVAQCNATELVVANSGECALSSILSSKEASTAGSSAESCPDACTMEYSPVTDENGVEYSNECAMRLAKCKGETGKKKKIINFTVLDEPTVVKGTKEAETPATKTTKATKSEKTGTASSSGIGSLFDDGSNGVIGSDSESGSADPTLVKGTKETPAPIEINKTPVEEATKTTKATKSTKSEKTGTASSSGIGSLFDDGSNGVIGDESAADGKVDPKMLTSIGITVPLGKEGSGGLNLGPGPAVYPSDSGSWDWSWDSIEGSSSTHYDCDTVCPADYEPVCGSDNVTYKNDCTFTVAQCNATELVVANSGECALSSILSSKEASTAGSSAESCPDACTMEYSPVTDENGVEYSNECAMRLAKCKGETGKKKKIINFTVLDEPTVVKGTKEAETPATKTTKATKSEKTGTASSSGIGSLFDDGSNGVIGSDSESGSADPTLVKGTKETPAPIEINKTPVEEATKTTKATKSTKSEKTGTASSSGIGSLFDDGSNGVIGSESGSADPTLVKAPAEKTVPALKTTKILP